MVSSRVVSSRVVSSLAESSLAEVEDSSEVLVSGDSGEGWIERGC